MIPRWQQLRSEWQDELRTLIEENSKLRALCAELHEAKGLLKFIKTQREPDQPPQ